MKIPFTAKTAVAVLVFLTALGVAIPNSTGRAPSAAIAMAATRSSELLPKAEKDYWDFLQ